MTGKKRLLSTIVLLMSLIMVGLFQGYLEAANVYTCKLATDEPEGTPKNKAQLFFIDRVAELTNNEVKITLYPGNQLGSSRELIESTQMGSIQAVAVPTSTVAGFEPKISIFDLPFLFPNREIGYAVIESEVGDAVLSTLEKHGLVGVAFYGTGWKQFTGNFKIEGPESFKGKKIRVMENPILITQFEALGAGAIPINFGELYNALQQSVVDGQENPIVTCYQMKFYEVQKYMAISDHAYLPNVFAFNKDWFYGLPKEHQQAIRTAGKEMDVVLQAEVKVQEMGKFLPEMKQYGIEVVELDQKTRAAFAEVIQEPTRARFFELVDEEGKELLKKVDEKIAQLQGK